MTATLEFLIQSRTTNETSVAPSREKPDFAFNHGTLYVVKRQDVSLASLVEIRTGYGTVTDTSERNFAVSLRSIKEHSGLSWGEIARTIGVSRRTIHNWLADARIRGVNAARVSGLYRAVTQELTGIPRSRARSFLLAPGDDGITPMSRITLGLRSNYVRQRPVIGGVDLLRTSAPGDDPIINGGLDASIPGVDLDELPDDGGHERS